MGAFGRTIAGGTTGGRRTMKHFVGALLLGAAVALGGCGGDKGGKDRPPSEEDAGPGGSCDQALAAGNLDCGQHGTCDDSSGTPLCACGLGYGGERCEACAAGYQDKDGDGECRPDCASAGLSCPKGQECSDESGTAACVPDGSLSAWTFMVYLAGDSNLGYDPSCVEAWQAYGEEAMAGALRFCDMASSDLREMLAAMEQAGESSDLINVIVLFDNNADSPIAGFSPRGRTVLYKVTRGGLETLDSGKEIFSGKEANMASADTLKKFGVWTVKNHPAQRYALVLWDHGGGWRDGDGEDKGRCGRAFGLTSVRPEIPWFREFSSDLTAGEGDTITLANGDYGKALKAITEQAGRKLDLVGFDACLMGMFEVAAATQDYADYLVASAETEPGEGWAYHMFLEKLAKAPEMGPRELGVHIADAYVSYYRGDPVYEDDSVVTTQAVYDLSTFGDLTDQLDAFGRAMLEAVSQGSDGEVGRHTRAILAASKKAHRYYMGDHADLKHLAVLIEAESELPEALRSAARGLLAQLDKTIVTAGHNNAPDTGGMAIFFPVTFNCCFDFDTYQTWIIETAEEYEACGGWPYSSLDCIPQETSMGAWYSYFDVVNFEYEGQTYTGDYYAGGWSRGWNDFLNDYYLRLFE